MWYSYIQEVRMMHLSVIIIVEGLFRGDLDGRPVGGYFYVDKDGEVEIEDMWYDDGDMDNTDEEMRILDKKVLDAAQDLIYNVINSRNYAAKTGRV